MSPQSGFRLAMLSGVLAVLGLDVPAWTRAPVPKSLKQPKEIENSIGMKLVLIPKGKFKMGSPKDEVGRLKEEEQHEVEISKPFYLGAFAVTQKQYKAVMKSNPSYFSPEGEGKDDVKGLDTGHFPVEQVSWHEAVDFCKKVSALVAEKKAGRTYRLPTEAQWEYACRGGASSTPFYFGKSLSSTQANFNGDHPYGGAGKGPYLRRTCKVGLYKPNTFGLHDLHGNVCQWCADPYEPDYYASSPPEGPGGPKESSDRVIQGGCWFTYGQLCRSATRLNQVPGFRSNGLGFRVALSSPNR